MVGHPLRTRRAGDPPSHSATTRTACCVRGVLAGAEVRNHPDIFFRLERGMQNPLRTVTPVRVRVRPTGIGGSQRQDDSSVPSKRVTTHRGSIRASPMDACFNRAAAIQKLGGKRPPLWGMLGLSSLPPSEENPRSKACNPLAFMHHRHRSVINR